MQTQDVIVEDMEYLIQDEELKSLYPDMLSAIIKNNSDEDIRDITYGFVAWDKNGLPIKLKKDIDFGNGQYFYEGIGESVNISSGETHGDNYGFELSKDLDEIHNFKAIVTEYEGFNGEKWSNPLVKDFKQIYEGNRLEDIKGHEETIFNRFGSSQTSTETDDTKQGNHSNDKENQSADVERFISNYFSDLETAYSTGDFSMIEGYLIEGTETYNQMRDNVSSNSFPNMKIYNLEIINQQQSEDTITVEVLSERSNDNIAGNTEYKTGYIILDEDGTLKIESYRDL